MTDTFTLTDRTERRLGYGAIQLCGSGVIGPPRHRHEATADLKLSEEDLAELAAVATPASQLTSYARQE